MNTQIKETTMTSEDFERWLSLQKTLGFTCTNPEVLEKIRENFRQGGTLATPVRETSYLKGAA